MISLIFFSSYFFSRWLQGGEQLWVPVLEQPSQRGPGGGPVHGEPAAQPAHPGLFHALQRHLPGLHRGRPGLWTPTQHHHQGRTEREREINLQMYPAFTKASWNKFWYLLNFLKLLFRWEWVAGADKIWRPEAAVAKRVVGCRLRNEAYVWDCRARPKHKKLPYPSEVFKIICQGVYWIFFELFKYCFLHYKNITIVRMVRNPTCLIAPTVPGLCWISDSSSSPPMIRSLSLVPADEEEKSLLGKLLQPLTGTVKLFNLKFVQYRYFFNLANIFCHYRYAILQYGTPTVPAAPQDHCGWCQIQTWNLCLRARWATSSQS